MRISYPASSPYSITPQSSWHIGRYKHIPIRPAADDELFTITTEFEYRPDKLAKRLYGSDSYWWVFTSRNPGVVRDPIWDFRAGSSIMIPSADYLKRVTGSR